MAIFELVDEQTGITIEVESDVEPTQDEAQQYLAQAQTMEVEPSLPEQPPTIEEATQIEPPKPVTTEVETTAQQDLPKQPKPKKKKALFDISQLPEFMQKSLKKQPKPKQKDLGTQFKELSKGILKEAKKTPEQLASVAKMYDVFAGEAIKFGGDVALFAPRVVNAVQSVIENAPYLSDADDVLRAAKIGFVGKEGDFINRAQKGFDEVGELLTREKLWTEADADLKSAQLASEPLLHMIMINQMAKGLIKSAPALVQKSKQIVSKVSQDVKNFLRSFKPDMQFTVQEAKNVRTALQNVRRLSPEKSGQWEKELDFLTPRERMLYDGVTEFGRGRLKQGKLSQLEVDILKKQVRPQPTGRAIEAPGAKAPEAPVPEPPAPEPFQPRGAVLSKAELSTLPKPNLKPQMKDNLQLILGRDVPDEEMIALVETYRSYVSPDDFQGMIQERFGVTPDQAKNIQSVMDRDIILTDAEFRTRSIAENTAAQIGTGTEEAKIAAEGADISPPVEDNVVSDAGITQDTPTFTSEGTKAAVPKQNRSQIRETIEEKVEIAKAKWLKNNPGKEVTPEIESAIQLSVDEASRNAASGLPSARHKNSKIAQIREVPEGYVNVFLEADLDLFKRFNDNFGQQFGDLVLERSMKAANSIAKILKKTQFHETGDEWSAVDQIKIEDLEQFLKDFTEFKKRLSLVEIELPNGKTVPLSTTMSVSTDLGAAGNLLKSTKKANKNSLTFDESLKKQFPGLQDQIGKDLKDVYEKAGLKPTTREVGADVPVPGEKGSRPTGPDAEVPPGPPGPRQPVPSRPPKKKKSVAQILQERQEIERLRTELGEDVAKFDVEVSKIRRKLKDTPKVHIKERERLAGEMARFKKQRSIATGKVFEAVTGEKVDLNTKDAQQIRNAIYQYGRKIRLQAEPYNRVDTILKNAKTVRDLEKAIVIMDNVLSKRQTSRLRKKLTSVLKQEKARLQRVRGKAKSTLDILANRQLQRYIDQITLLPEKRLDAIRRTAAAIEAQPDAVITDAMRSDIAESFKTSLSELDDNAIRKVLFDIRQIKKQGRLKHQLKREQENRRREAEAQTAAQEVIRATKAPTTPLQEATRRREGRIQKFAKDYAWGIIRPFRLVQFMTGFKGNAFKRNTYDVLWDATKQKLTNMRRATDEFKKRYKGFDIGRAITKPFTTVMVDGPKGKQSVTLTLNQAMDIYANAQNEGGLAHLYGTMSPDVVEEIISQIPQDVKTLIDGQIDYYDQIEYGRINKQFAKDNDVDMPKVHRYFPGLNIKTNNAESALITDLLARYGSRPASVSKGFTKSRVESGAPFRNLGYFQKVVRHMHDVEHYLAMQDGITHVRKFLANKDLRAAMEAKSPAATRELDDWVRAVAYGRVRGGDAPLDKLSEFLRTNIVTSTLGFNLVTALKQPASFAQGLEQVNKADAMWSAMQILKERSKAFEFANSKSEAMKQRSKQVEREIAEMLESSQLQEALGTKNLYNKFREWAFVPIQAMDKMTTTILFNAKYREQINQGASEETAVRKADELISTTQPAGGIINLPSAYRKGGLARAFTTFTNQLNQNFNLAFELKGTFKDKGTAQNASAIFYRFILPPLLIQMASHGIAPWEPGRLADDPEGLMLGMFLNVFGGMPLLGTVAGIGLNTMLNEIREARGAKRQRVPAQISPVSFNVMESGLDFIEDPSIGSGIQVGAQLVGLPYTQPRRTVKGIQRKLKGEEVDPRGYVWSEYALKDKSVRSAMKDRMKSTRWQENVKLFDWYDKLDDSEKKQFREENPEFKSQWRAVRRRIKQRGRKIEQLKKRADRDLDKQRMTPQEHKTRIEQLSTEEEEYNNTKKKLDLISRLNRYKTGLGR